MAVVGPCAADPRTFMGCYSFPNHVLPRYPDLGLGVEVRSALDALRVEFPEVEVVHKRGCDIQGDDRSGFAARAVSAAREADLCVALVGDLAGLFGHGTSGEGCDAEDLRLPGVQANLLDEVLATGTPVVVVVVSGRPYALGDVHGRAAGLVQAFMPGEEGGQAIVGVLSGRIRPSGRLPVGIPRRRAASPEPTCSRPSVRKIRARETSTRHHYFRSGTAAPTPRPRSTDSASAVTRCRPTASSRHPYGPQHRAARW